MNQQNPMKFASLCIDANVFLFVRQFEMEIFDAIGAVFDVLFYSIIYA